MPFIKLQFKPGVNRDMTDYSNEGGWFEGNKIRFRSGYPEKIGGWVKSSPTAFAGVCRQMWNWITSYSDDFLAVGTNSKVYIETGGNYYDITPLRTTTPTYTGANTNNSIYTTSGSNIVRVTLATNPSAVEGGYVDISGVVTTPFTVGFTNGSANITGTGLPAVGTLVQFATTGALPTNFTSGDDYYVKSNTSGTTITVAISAGGTAIVAGSAGSGTQTLTGTVGGIPVSEFNTTHLIATAGTPANSFTYTTTTAATSTVSATGGTGITVSFEIEPGNAIAVIGSGWGIGGWGRDSWGLGASGATYYLPQRDWWFDNFDNDLVMNIRNGAPYWWYRVATADPTSSLAARAITLQAYATAQGGDATYVPTQVMQLLVSQQDRHLIAFGCDFGSVIPNSFDPLLIRWASQDSPENWVPSATSSAGDFRVSRGSRIIRGLPTRQEVLVWTDTHLYTLQFTGTTDVFALQEYGDNISVASPRCMISAANVVYWMGQDKFYAYTGRIETLPCTLRNHVFMDINFNQAEQIVCGTNEQWNEVWWFYPTADSDYNNAYVIYNYLEQIWYYGTIDRTAWLDTPLRPFPQAANTTVTNGVAGSGYVYSHEDGVDDDDAPMVSYIQSSDFDIGDGDNFMLTRRMIPDVSFDGSTAASPEATLTIRPRNFPGGSVQSDPTDTQRVIETTANQYTNQVFMRARARQMAFKIQSENLGVQWQLGSPRLDARQDGSR